MVFYLYYCHLHYFLRADLKMSEGLFLFSQELELVFQVSLQEHELLLSYLDQQQVLQFFETALDLKLVSF